jgi:hypothetical protein
MRRNARTVTWTGYRDWYRRLQNTSRRPAGYITVTCVDAGAPRLGENWAFNRVIQDLRYVGFASLKGLLGAAALAAPLIAFSESNLQIGANTNNPGATAHTDFQIVIPKILYLRVGTGSSYVTGALTNNPTVDRIAFRPAAAVVGDGVPVAGVGGNLAGGIETAAVVSNSGNVTLNVTSAGALNNGGPGTIAFTQITTTASTLNSATPLPAPALANGVSGNVMLVAPAAKVINEDAKWTYKYANTTLPPAGTYGGVNVRNGRVVYTATMP